MKSIFSLLFFLLHISTLKAQAPTNDDPTGAVTLTPSTTICGNSVSSTTIGATQTTTPGTTADSDDDVWFKLPSGTSGNHFISLSNVTFNNTAIDNQVWIKLWQKNGTTWTPYAPTGDGYYNTNNLGGSVEWYIEIYTIDVTSRANFNICVRSAQTIFPNPPNDEYTGAFSLTSNNCCSNTMTTNINATQSTQPLSVAGASRDVWYKFNAVSAVTRIELSNIVFAPGTNYPIYPSGAGTSNLGIELGTMSGATFTAISTINGSSLTVNSLTPGQEYFIRVVSVNTQHTRFADFNICVAHGNAINNEAATATPIVADNANCYNPASTINGSTLGATQSPQSNCSPGTHYDTWYSFTATNNLCRIKLQLTAPVQSPNISLWSSDGNTQITCNNQIGLNYVELVSPVTSGTSYKIRVAGYAGTYLTCFSLSALCSATPQTNNDCSTPKTLPQLENNVTGSIVGENLSGTWTDPSPTLTNAGCGTEVGGDLWYTFTALKNEITIRTVNVSPSEPLAIMLYPDGCTANTPIQTSCNGVLIASVTPGNTYLVRILAVNGCNSISFDINTLVPPAPINNECAGAITIPFNSSPHSVPLNKINGTNLNSTNSSAPLSPSCLYTDVSDVWYKFTTGANANNIDLVLSDKTQIFFGFGFLTYSLHHGTCGALVNDDCNIIPFNGVIHKTSLLPNTTYYLRLFGSDFKSQFNYKLHWQQTPTPTNITMASAQTLIATSDQSASFVEGNTQAPADEVDCINAGVGSVSRGVWYKFVATATTHQLEVTSVVTLSEDQAFAQAKVSGAIPTVCFPQIATSDGLLTGLTIGNEYFVLVLDNTLNGGPIGFKIRVIGASSSPNNEVANAITIVQNPECNSPISGSLNNATVTAMPALPPAPMHTYQADVWYKFVATSTAVYFDINLNEVQADMYLYNSMLATPAIMTSSLFFGNNITNAIGLTVGQTYYIRIAKYAAAALSIGSQNNFTICVYGMPTTSIASQPAAAMSCMAVDGPVISTNSNTWLHITDGGNVLASIFDNGGTMGVINASYYYTSTVRSTATGLEYLGRNFDITPTTQPTSPVQVRLYFSRAELLTLIGANDGDLNDVFDVSDLLVNRFSGVPCALTLTGSGITYPVTGFGNLGVNNYYLQVTIPSFSSFFIHAPDPGSLPLKFVSVTCSTNNRINYLSWKIADAININYFEIEKSNNGVQFNKVTTVPYNNNSTFNWNETTSSTQSFYRIKAVDFDRSFIYSKILKLEPKTVSSFEITPNIIQNNLLQINTFTSDPKNIVIKIYDAKGKLVLLKNTTINANTGTIQIDINSLNKGVYFIKIANDLNTEVLRFVKM